MIEKPTYRRREFLPARARYAMLAIVLLAFAIVPLSGRAEITLDNTSSASGNFLILFWSHTVGPGTDHYLLVSVATQGATTAFVSYAGTPLTRIGARANGGGPNVEIWGGTVTPGTANVLVFQSALFSPIAAGAVSFSGVDQTTSTGTFVSAIGNSTGPTVAAVPAGAGDVVVDALATAASAGTRTPVAPQQQLFSVQSPGAGAAAAGGSGRGTEVAASITMSWTLSTGGAWALGAVALKPAVFTRAIIGTFQVRSSIAGGGVVAWETLSEHGSVGFHLMRLDEKSGQYRRLNERLLPARLHARSGSRYRFRDPDVEPGGTYTYKLVELESTGNRLSHGPYTVSASTFDDSPMELVMSAGASASMFESEERPLSARQQARIVANKTARRDARRKRRARRGPVAKISIREPGIYHVDAATLASVLGKSESRVRRLVERNRLSLRRRGKSVATMAADANDGFYFYGDAFAGQYTDENVYWLSIERGVPVRTRSARRPGPIDGQSFRDSSHAEGNRYTLTHLFDDPDDDYWMWDFRFQDEPHPEYEEFFIVASPGVDKASDETATLTVRMHGGSDAEHRASVFLNGSELGVAVFQGLSPHVVSFDVDVSLLEDGDNRVQIDGYASPDPERPSIFYINDFDLGYPRRYAAADHMLRMDSAGHRIVTVAGFESAAIHVFDLADPELPMLLTDTTIDRFAGAHRVSFRAPRADRTYLAITPQAIRSPESVIADRRSNLRRRGHRVDYLVITATDLLEAARTLAGYRATQGLRTMVVDVEDIYDEFNYGIRDADAIWAFLRYAYTKWRVAPRYVVLAGEGSIDYRNYLGYGDAIVPALLTPTPEGLFPSDNLYVDVVGNDWLAEMAVGRLPVIDAAELQAVVEKLVAYEGAGGAWQKEVIVAADAPDSGGDFPRDSDSVARLFPPDYMVEPVHLDELSPAEARGRLLDGIRAGRAFVNFFGHADHLSLGNDDLLTVADAATLDNEDRLPVVTAFTCLAGQFGFPGQDSVAEVLLIAPDGGAVAVWAPTGLSLNSRARLLGEGFYSATFEDAERIIGEVILKAQARYASDGTDKYLLDIYNLIGDPATVMK